MKKLITTLLISTMLASCSLVPDYKRPEVAAPGQWSNGEGRQETPRLAFDWWKSFGSDELNQLMAEGLNNNLDLKASFQRIEQSRASLTVARSSLFPTLDASADISRSKSLRDGGSSINQNISGLGSSSRGDGDTNFNGGLQVSYELDLFGANRSEIDSSRAALLSTKYQYDALALVVMGDVSQTYFNILSARERLQIADQNLKNAQEILRIVDARYQAGAASGLEMAQQKSSLGSFEANRAAILQEITVYENALAILLAKPPQTVPVAKQDLNNLIIPGIAPAQPSTLLTRRPDIASAEADLIAANADIGAARAAFFPSITLGAGVSAIASPISSSMTSALSTTSAILAPIFRGGALIGNLGITKARQLELAETYRKTVLVAFQEVEDALAAEKASAQRELSFKTAMDEAQKAYDISMLRYKAGSIDFQTVIDSQNALLTAQQSYSLSRNERLGAAISLFKALGGGWKSHQALKN
ncbi:MAG: transporter [Micavibrio aeruginosavorus]|uniref:Transporter n=1 Tax=Micavibrio aeruginosavorus TaxID=349221 RepID=A0A2W5FH49_9BACT|nr:MAG: transporter [Micavibrio aeruginosavorus]